MWDYGGVSELEAVGLHLRLTKRMILLVELLVEEDSWNGFDKSGRS